jgi:hypothetical protein
MKLKSKRVALKPTYTISKLSINDTYFCDILEDEVRDFNKDGDLTDAGEGKIFGKTAIPYGTYKIIITYSNRFKRNLPLLLDVPGFEGIRIHPGNTAEDTHGCLLVGQNKEIGKVINSKICFDNLFEKIELAITDGEEVTIEIV